MLYISKGHKKTGPNEDPGAVFKELTEAGEINLITQALALELSKLNVSYCILEDLTLRDTIAFLNKQMRPGDIAIELHKDSFNAKDTRRVGCYVSLESKLSSKFTSIFLEKFKPECSPVSWVRTFKERNLAFVRDVKFASVIVELGHIEDDNCVSDRNYYAQRLAITIRDFLKQ